MIVKPVLVCSSMTYMPLLLVVCVVVQRTLGRGRESSSEVNQRIITTKVFEVQKMSECVAAREQINWIDFFVVYYYCYYYCTVL